MYGSQWGTLQLHTVYKKSYFYYKSRKNPYHYCKNPYQYCKSRENMYQVLQVTRAASECAMKLKVRMIKSLSPQYQVIPEKLSLVLWPSVLLLVLCTRNNTDGNKLVIFSGIQWNPSIMDTIGTQHFVHYSEVSLTQGLPVYFR